MHFKSVLPTWSTPMIRGGSRTAATSKMELFVIIVNGCKSLIIITMSCILDVAAILDPLLHDDLEQYGRCLSVRVEDIPVATDKTAETFLKKSRTF